MSAKSSVILGVLLFLLPSSFCVFFAAEGKFLLKKQLKFDF